MRMMILDMAMQADYNTATTIVVNTASSIITLLFKYRCRIAVLYFFDDFSMYVKVDIYVYCF